MDSTVRFGLGRRCINPTMPISLAGYFNIRLWDKVLDDLEVRVLVMEKGGGRAIIINYDLITVTTEMYEDLRAKITAAFGAGKIEAENLIVCATHTHTAPEVRGRNGGSDSAYLPFLYERTVEALQEALASMRDGELRGTLTRDSRFIFNRRYWMKDGRVVTNPGKLNPDIVRPEGEIDPEIPIMAICRDGQPFVVVPSIVNHTDTIGGNGVSADWPGFLRRSIEAGLPAGGMLLPLVGCQGNINHFDVRDSFCQTHYPEAERIGRGYAETVGRALAELQPVAFAAVRCVTGVARGGSRELEPEEIRQAQEIMDRYPEVSISRDSAKDLTSEDLARKTPFALKYFASKLLEMQNENLPREFRLTGFELGNIFVAGMPSEPFTELGLRVRKGFFRRHLCLVAALSNGAGHRAGGGGYIPNAWNYGRGGYEDTPRSSPFSKDTAENILDAWKQLARSFEK